MDDEDILPNELQKVIERHRSLDQSGDPFETDQGYSEFVFEDWMCGFCGAFMKSRTRFCKNCQSERP